MTMNPHASADELINLILIARQSAGVKVGSAVHVIIEGEIDIDSIIKNYGREVYKATNAVLVSLGNLDVDHEVYIEGRIAGNDVRLGVREVDETFYVSTGY